MTDPIGSTFWQGGQPRSADNAFAFSGKRLLLGVFSPPFIAATVIVVSYWVQALVTNKAFSYDGIHLIYIYGYLWGGIQSILGSFFMEWAGRRIFRNELGYAPRTKFIYIATGTALGGVAAAAINVYFGDYSTFGLIPYCLVAGLIMSLIMLRFWKAELNSPSATEDSTNVHTGL